MQAVHLHTEDGFVVALLGDKDRIYTPYVALTFPIRKRRIANGDVAKFTRPLTIGHNKKQRPYPLTKLVNHLLRIGKAHGISKGARTMLMKAKA